MDRILNNSAENVLTTSPKWYDELNAEINNHQQIVHNRSYLADGLDYLWHRDQTSEQKLESLKAEADADLKSSDQEKLEVLTREAQTAVAEDQKELRHANLAIGIGSGIIKTSPLFIAGPLGWAATIAINGLDAAKPDDDIKDQAIDFALGAIKGALAKGSLRLVNGLGLSTGALGFAARGTLIGMAQRTIGSTFDTSNYYDRNGRFDAFGAAGRIAYSVTNPGALLADAATFAIAGAADTSVNLLFRGALTRSAYLEKLTTGATMGLLVGMSGEASSEWQKEGSLSPMKVAKAGAEQMIASGLGALLGGSVQTHATAHAFDASRMPVGKK